MEKHQFFAIEGYGNKITLNCRTGENEKLPECKTNKLCYQCIVKRISPGNKYEVRLNPNLVDVVHYENLVYRIFWNKRYFSSKSSLRYLLSEQSILAIVSINNYKPLILIGEPIDNNDVGIIGYRLDGKAIMHGQAAVNEDRIVFNTTPVYRKVRLNSACHTQWQGTMVPPVQAGPSSGDGGY